MIDPLRRWRESERTVREILTGIAIKKVEG
jgi:hypothetical protein